MRTRPSLRITPAPRRYARPRLATRFPRPRTARWDTFSRQVANPVNASRPPGEWQAYDIIFHGPRFTKDGKLLHPARVTVLHNGVLVQDNVLLTGPTANGKRPPYKLHPEKLPLSLQDHGDPVRYRNIWIRELHED